MKGLKSFLACFLAATTFLAAAACGSANPSQKGNSQNGNSVNATGYPAVKDKITLKGFGRQDAQLSDWNTMNLWKAMGEKTNVYVQWETTPAASYEEKLNLLLASNDLPDVICKPTSNMSALLAKYGASGTFINVRGLIDQYAPSLKAKLQKYPDVEAALTTSDGNIYTFPTIYDDFSRRVSRYPLIDTKWLQKLGLKAPATQQEFLDVLTAFKTKDPNGNGNPNDEIPLSSHNFEIMMQTMESMYGLTRNMGYYINIENDKVHIWLPDKAHREALEFTKKLWDQGLIDKEIFTQTDSLFFGKLAAGKVGFAPLRQPKNAGDYANDYDAIEPIPGPDGTRIWSYLSPRMEQVGSLEISKSNQYPEATVRWIDYLYTDECMKLMYLGIEGKTYTKDDKGVYHYADDVLNNPKGLEWAAGTWGIYPGGGEPGFADSSVMQPSMEGTPMGTYIGKVQKYLPEEVYNPPIMSVEDADTVNNINSELTTYAKEMRTKFVMGEVPLTDASWKDFTDQMNKLGLEQLESIYQKYYDKNFKKS